MSNELIEETTGINHVEVIQTVIASLVQDESAMVSKTRKAMFGSLGTAVGCLCNSRGWLTRTPYGLVFGAETANDEVRLMRHLWK